MALIAIAGSLLLQAAALLAAHRLAPAGSVRRRLALAAALAALLLAAWAIDGPRLAALIVWPGLPWWGNLCPVAAALALGLARHESRRLRWGLLALLALAELWLAWPSLRADPVDGPGAELEGVVLQTSERTCGPAAAANLLRLDGLAADEALLSRLCHTTTAGTTDWGIVDGLRSRSGAPVRFVRIPFAELTPALLPAVVSVRLDAAAAARDPRYAERWGWIPDVRHAIVVEAVEGSRVRVIDPAIGRETWDRRALEDLWDRSVITLR